MTHMREMSESEGTFRPEAPTKYQCRKCGQLAVTCQTWESSCGGYEDYKYTCGDCGDVRWVDGIDS